jgi:hypothetical protein
MGLIDGLLTKAVFGLLFQLLQKLRLFLQSRLVQFLILSLSKALFIAKAGELENSRLACSA